MKPLDLSVFITSSGSPLTPVSKISGAPNTGPPTVSRGFLGSGAGAGVAPAVAAVVALAVASAAAAGEPAGAGRTASAVPAGALAGGAACVAGEIRAGRAGAAAAPGGATAGGFALGIGAGAATVNSASPRARPASTGSVAGSGLLGERAKLPGIGGTTPGGFPELLDLRLFAGDLPWRSSSSLSELWPFLKGLCSLPPKSDLPLPLVLLLPSSLSSESDVSPFLKGLDSLSILLENRDEKLFFLDDLPAESVSDMVAGDCSQQHAAVSGCPGRNVTGDVLSFAGHGSTSRHTHRRAMIRLCP